MQKISILFSLLLICLMSCNNEEIIFNSNPGVDNVAEERIKLYAQKEFGISTKGVGLTHKFWEPGQTIRIKFLNGTETQKSKVMQFSQEWTEYANLNFEFVDTSESADVKIAFDWQGDRVTWSHIGTDAKTIPQNYPSLNFGNLSTLDRFIKRDVLMQFGHVLGLVNEHQGVNNTLELDTALIYDYYLGEGWSFLEITNFFFNPYASEITNYTDYDSRSIMVWPIDEIFTTNGMGQLRNSELSDMDKEFIAQIYPNDGADDSRYTILRLSYEEEFNIDWKTVLNTSEIVYIDFGDGIQYEGLGDAIPSHTYQAGDYEVRIEAERISITFSYQNLSINGKPVKYVKLNGTTEYEYIEFSSTSLQEIECDPDNAPILLQTSFNYTFNKTSIQTIPKNLFYNCDKLENLYNTFSYCSNLIQIPESLFVNCNNLTKLQSVFVECTSLIEIPEKLFHFSPKITSFSSTFYGCTSLTSIPESLFYYTPEVTNFRTCFYECQSLTEIPENLFKNCPEVTNFYAVFAHCNLLTKIPGGLFTNCTKVTSFEFSFYWCTSLIELPEGLFKNLNKVKNFSECFYGCSLIKNIPENLFENCTEVTNFGGCFRRWTSLQYIPENLFKDTPKVTDFSATFREATSIETIPENLFQFCPELRKVDFCFHGCTSLTEIPAALYANNSKIITFTYGFAGCVNLIGEAPKYWERENVWTGGGEGCFSQCTNLSNYAEIPSDWK